MNLFNGYKRNQHLITHNGSKTKLYGIWKAMKTRCNNPNIPQSHNYSKRGISLCNEWNDSFITFRKWAIENGYEGGLSIDRIDNDGNYEPSNCKWSTRIEQCNNKTTNIHLEYMGETKTLANWSRLLNINERTLNARCNRGYSIEQILGFEPLVFNFKPSKSIIQMNMDGDFIKEFDSVKSAKESLKLYHITDCCRGKRNSCGGYRWKYKEGDTSE